MIELTRDDQHSIWHTARADRYVVATPAGRLVGTVYFTTRGWRCWRDGESTIVSNLHGVLAHYRS